MTDSQTSFANGVIQHRQPQQQQQVHSIVNLSCLQSENHAGLFFVQRLQYQNRLKDEAIAKASLIITELTAQNTVLTEKIGSLTNYYKEELQGYKAQIRILLEYKPNSKPILLNNSQQQQQRQNKRYRYETQELRFELQKRHLQQQFLDTREQFNSYLNVSSIVQDKNRPIKPNMQMRNSHCSAPKNRTLETPSECSPRKIMKNISYNDITHTSLTSEVTPLKRDNLLNKNNALCSNALYDSRRIQPFRNNTHNHKEKNGRTRDNKQHQRAKTCQDSRSEFQAAVDSIKDKIVHLRTRLDHRDLGRETTPVSTKYQKILYQSGVKPKSQYSAKFKNPRDYYLQKAVRRVL